MNIPLVNLKRQEEEIFEEIMSAVRKVCECKDFILGEDVRLFEEEFALFCGVEYAIGVASGTDALHLALRACGIGEGNEVIVPSNSFIATALGVSFAGARPVFVDADLPNYQMDPKAFEKAITHRTKAVIPVHLYGYIGSIEEISRIAKKRGIFVIEDACQAHGAELNGKKAGSFGDLGCFSFYPGKNLGGYGDGGLVVTRNKELAEKIRLLRDYGRIGKYEHKSIGYNSRLDTLQAAVLRVKLKKLTQWNEHRKQCALEYCNRLQGLPVVLPSEEMHKRSIFHLYVIRVKERDRVLKFLNGNGVGAGIHYPIPIHLQEAYKDLGYKKGSMLVSETLSDEALSLPMDGAITIEELEKIVEVLKKAIN